MPISPEHYLQCISDGFIPVRDASTRLLGCIPGTPPPDDFQNTTIGNMEVRATLSYCLVPNETQMAMLLHWEGFIPTAEAFVSHPVGTGTSDDTSDVGRPI